MTEDIFFKFRKIDKHLIESLKNGTIYFASTDQLNDPFDCRVDIKQAAKQAIKQLSGRKKEILTGLVKIEGYFDQILKNNRNVAVCSFSMILEEPLLWSHYAGKHTGLCLAYEFLESFLNNPEEIVGAAPVGYKDNSMTEWFVDNTPTVEQDFKEFTIEIAKKALTIKSPDWEYEKEIRIIRMENGPFKIEKKQLKQICFGLHTTESDIDLIRKIVSDAGYSVDYCKIEKGQNDFEISAKEIQQTREQLHKTSNREEWKHMVIRFLKFISVIMFIGTPLTIAYLDPSYNSLELSLLSVLFWMLIPLLWGLVLGLRWAITGKWREIEKEE